MSKKNVKSKKAEDNVEEMQCSGETTKECIKNDDDSTAEHVENTDDKLAETEKKLEECTDKYQRVLAEYYNYRERTSKEKASMYNDGLRDTVEKLLPVIDNLERAVISQTETESSLYKGVEMTLKQFKEILNSIGVEEIPAKGEKFDPNLHSAVSHIEDENFGENEITVEMVKGYKMKDKVIRYSMVQVAN